MKHPLSLKIVIAAQAIVAALFGLIAIGLTWFYVALPTNGDALPNILLTPILWIANFFYFIIFYDFPTGSEVFTFLAIAGIPIVCFFILLSLSTALLAWGFWRLKIWSWRVMMWVQCLSVLASFFGLFLDSNIYAPIYTANLMIALPLFVYFSRREIKRIFNIKEPAFKI